MKQRFAWLLAAPQDTKLSDLRVVGSYVYMVRAAAFFCSVFCSKALSRSAQCVAALPSCLLLACTALHRLQILVAVASCAAQSK